jgi:hypothetical protein
MRSRDEGNGLNTTCTCPPSFSVTNWQRGNT